MKQLLNLGLGRIPGLFKLWQHYFKFIHPEFMKVRDFKLTTQVPNEYIMTSYYYGNWGGKMFEEFSDSIRKESIVFDIGSHIGYFTLEAGSKRAKKIYSFEPNVTSFKILEKNIEINRLDNVTIENKAVSDKNKSLDFYDIREAGIGMWRKIEVIRLDDYTRENGIEKIDILKIDVDGFELEVIKGARKIIRASKKIKIFLEIMLKDTTSKDIAKEIIPKEILDFIKEEGFKIKIYGYESFSDHEQMEVLLER